MAKRIPTLEDLIAANAKTGETMTAWCTRKRFPVRSLARLLNDDTEPRLATMTLLASALGLTSEPEDLDKLRAAIAASRAAAKR